MSTATSLSTRQVYGVQRVCAAWAFARSTYYAPDLAGPMTLAKRGPKTNLDDTSLLTLIRADLAASPFKGEGHRKVWARLRYVEGHEVGRHRILRLMRLHRLLSPHRTRFSPAKAHDGRICTDAPISAGRPTEQRCGPATTDGCGCLPHWSTGTPNASVITCVKRATASPPTSPSPKPCGASSEVARPTPPAASNCDTVTAVNTSPTTSRTRVASAALPPASSCSASP